MALKTKVELETLDVVFLGEPYVRVSTTTIASTDLDTVFLGEPFVATDPPGGGGGVTEQGAANLSSFATVDLVADKISDADIALSSTVSFTAVGGLIIDNIVALSATATTSTQASKTVSAGAEFQGAFTPSLTAIVIKNTGSAVIVTAELSANSVVNRSADIALDTLANLSAQSDRVRNFTSSVVSDSAVAATVNLVVDTASNLQSESSLTTSPEIIKDITADLACEGFAVTTAVNIYTGLCLMEAEFVQNIIVDVVITTSANLSASAGLTANVIRIEQFSSALSATATQSVPVTRRTRQIRRLPKTITRSGAIISTAQRQFGVSSVEFDGGERLDIATHPDFGFGTGAFSIQFWYRPVDSNHTILDFRSGTNSDPAIWLESANRQLKLYIGTTNIITFSTQHTLNTWNYVVISKSGSTISLSRNGVTQSVTNTSNLGTTKPFRLGCDRTDNNFMTGYIDELRINKGVSQTATEPTEPFRNDANTVLLCHFDGANNSTTFLDDGGEYFDAVATLSLSSVSIKRAQASLSAQGFVVAAAGEITQGDVILNADFNMSVLAGQRKGLSANLSTTASLVANVQERDLASANLSASFGLSASLTAVILGGSASLSATFSQSANVREIPVDGWASQPNVRFLLHADSAPLVDETNNSTVTLETITEIPERSGTIVGGKFSNGVKGAFTTNQSNQLVVGTNDFILDGWFKPIDAVGTNDVDFGFLSDRVNNSRNLVGFIGIERQAPNAGRLIYVVPGGSFTTPDIVSSIAYPMDGQFHHIMLSRNNYVIRLFIDGQSVGSAINYVNFTNNKISSDLQNPSIVDEVRLVIGEGQSTNFTPKTTPYAPIKQLYAVLETFSNFNLPEGLIVKFGQASLTSTATQTASVRRIRLGSASLTSTATVSVSATNIKRATSALSATASQTAQGIITKNTSGSLTSTASVSVAVTRIRSTTSAQTSAFTLTAQASRIRVGDSALSVTASQTANNSRTRNFDTAFDSIASQLAAVARIGDGFVAVDVNATMAVSAVKTATAVSEQQVNANISAQGIATVFGNSSLNSNFTATINIERVKPVGGELSATFTQTATVRKITDFVKNFEVTATVSADNTRVRASSSALASTATQNTVGDYLRLAQGTLSVNTELFVTVFSLVKAEANLQCQGFQLTAGRVIHLDPYYTYIIPQESREYIITEETREFKIEQETRKYIV